MSVGRDPVDRVIDIAVATPVCTVVVAREALPLIARAGSRTTMGAFERLLRSPAEPVRRTRTRSWLDEDHVEHSVHGGHAPAPPVPTIPDDDDLTAQQVRDRLAELPTDELADTRRYELAHRRRRTVLGKIAQLTS